MDLPIWYKMPKVHISNFICNWKKNLDALHKKKVIEILELRKILLETFTLILDNGKTKFAYLAVEGFQVWKIITTIKKIS